MENSIEVKAKTVHEAIEDACEQLGVSQEDLDIEVLSQGGMFGKAKIRATVKASAIKSAPKNHGAPAPTSPSIDIIGDTESDIVPGKTSIGHKVTLPDPDAKHLDKFSTSAAPVKHGQELIVENTEITLSSPELPAIQAQPKIPGKKFQITTDFVKKLLELLENDSAVTTEETETQFNININGENIGRIIGKNGMALSALQTLVSQIAISHSFGETKRVYVNAGDYKEKRGDTLQQMAAKKADYVKKTGRFVKLDPMNARDRAIIHTALQGVPGIKTYSTGKEPFRCLCIAPADGEPRPE